MVCAELFMVTVKFMHGESVLVFMSYSSACSSIGSWFIIGSFWVIFGNQSLFDR